MNHDYTTLPINSLTYEQIYTISVWLDSRKYMAFLSPTQISYRLDRSKLYHAYVQRKSRRKIRFGIVIGKTNRVFIPLRRMRLTPNKNAGIFMHRLILGVMIHLGLMKPITRAIDPGSSATFHLCQQVWKRFLNLELEEHQLQHRQDVVHG